MLTNGIKTGNVFTVLAFALILVLGPIERNKRIHVCGKLLMGLNKVYYTNLSIDRGHIIRERTIPKRCARRSGQKNMIEFVNYQFAYSFLPHFFFVGFSIGNKTVDPLHFTPLLHSIEIIRMQNYVFIRRIVCYNGSYGISIDTSLISILDRLDFGTHSLFAITRLLTNIVSYK